MKKILFGLAALFAVVAFVAAPAAADLKLTSSGYMQVQGMYISGNPGDSDGRSNDWYNMEMIVNPVLHINDRVRINSEIRIMERNFSGTADGQRYSTDAAESKYNVFGDDQNNFWVNRLWLTIRAFNGDLRFGRMSGGNWAHPFSDSDEDRDRIMYVGRLFQEGFLKDITWVIMPVEKRNERDGGQVAPRVGNLATDPSWDAADNDQDAYALGFVIPIGKMILFRPLYYGVRDGTGGFVYPNDASDPNFAHLFLNGLDFNFGAFKIQTEFDYGFTTFDDVIMANGRTEDVDVTSFAFWGEASFTTGPFEIAGGGFYIQGNDQDNPNSGGSRVFPYFTSGNLYEPTLLMFSEDMGLFYASAGVPNGSVAGASGYQSLLVRGSYKLTDTMKLSAIWQYLQADEMQLQGVDDELGNEIDVSFAWKFMPNLTYTVTGGYFMAGDYFEDRFGDNEDVYGVRNTIRVEW